MKRIIATILLITTLLIAQPFSIRDRYNIVTSTTNIFLGQYAGAATTTGTKNILLGSYAGYVLTTGYSNIYIGNDAGKSGSTGDAIGNVCIGEGAGNYMRTGQTNVYVGFNAGVYNTTGTTNTFIGNEAGYGSNVSGMSGTCNVGSGGRVGKALTSGSYNVFNGYDCGYASTTAIGNTFIGTSTGSTNTTGKYNIGIGYDQDMTAVGSDSLYFLGVTPAKPLMYGNFKQTTTATPVRGVTIDGSLNYGGSNASGNDTYVVTITGVSAYRTGMMIIFRPVTDNTGACTVNVNSLGAKAIKTQVGGDPVDSYLDANSVTMAVYDGTNFVLMIPDANP